MLGVINVAGGDSASNFGYGGAGGRIAVLCTWRYQFGGEFVNVGGLGGSNNYLEQAGAAGKKFLVFVLILFFLNFLKELHIKRKIKDLLNTGN